MISFPLVDAHVHLWDPKALRYDWLKGKELLDRPYLPADFDKARGDVEVEKIVFVECGCEAAQSLDEVAWVTDLARHEPHLAGIVAAAPLEKGDAVKPALEALAKNKLVKGVRRLLQGEADPAYCLRPEFIAGVRLLAPLGLSFDICITHAQLESATELVRRCPGVRFVLDHVAKPDIKNQVMEPWKTNLKKMAALPGVACKLSGLATEAHWQKWTPDDLRPYIDHVIECFGFGRLMYGGDWPVARQATDYPRWVNTLDAAAAGASDGERRQLFRETALSVYKLA